MHTVEEISERLEVTPSTTEIDMHPSIPDYDPYDDAKQRFDIIVDKNAQTLSTKMRQKYFIDDYGRPNRDSWLPEVRYFFDRIVPPDVTSHFKKHWGEDVVYLVVAVMIEIRVSSLQQSNHDSFLIYSPSMPGRDFEFLVADKLIKAGADVAFTPATGDQGADLIVRFKGEKIVVQCKRSASTVGNKAVQEAYAGCKFHDAEQAWVVSDAPFSRSAHQLANSLSVRLVDFNQVEASL